MAQTIDIVWKNYRADLPSRGYWDQAMIEDLFNGEIWSWENQYEFRHLEDFKEVGDGCVVVLPARNQIEAVEKLNADISRLKWVVIMLTGDEESVFPYEKIVHPNYKLWVMSPNPLRHKGIRCLGSGYTPHERSTLKKIKIPDKTVDWYFAGQVNTSRRKECIGALDATKARGIDGMCRPSSGFAQGIDQKEYYKELANSKIAVCPAGGFTPDTFRLFEALEAGCIPIADEWCDAYQSEVSYWGWFFEDIIPFPLLRSYHGLPEYIDETLPDWKEKSNKVFSWWQSKKRKMAYDLRDDIKQLSGIDFEDNITVLIPTSPIQAHPSTKVIDQCIKDVRIKLPKAEIIITIDGVREEQKKWKDNYEEYIKRLLWKCNFEWKNVLPMIFNEHTHQVGMTREALKLVKTPTILFVEHDAPICPDVEFGYSWDELVKTILEGNANMIRFHHEASILPESKGLLMSKVEKVNGVPMVKTMEWSQRPHLASTQFYRNILDRYFSPEANTMIEDIIYGKCLNDCKDNGIMGWYNWRVWIFHPEGDNIKRSYHLDARGEESKYDDTFKA